MSLHPNETPAPRTQTTDLKTSDVPELPPPPNPSSDPRLAVVEGDSPRAAPQLSGDISKLSPRAALKLLSIGIEALVRVTGDIPPTPPPTTPTMPHMKGMQLEKESILRSNSEKDLARMRQQAEAEDEVQVKVESASQLRSASSQEPSSVSQLSSLPSGSSGSAVSQTIDGVHLRPNPPPPQPQPSEAPEPNTIIGQNSQPVNLQHGAITRKFYSKKPPPISIEDYLSRLHRFCPMSTAVYLATSLYIHRLAVDERAVAVTGRNAHRLVLAGLRVAMKALEDLSYSHCKIAKVGGVSETELARLEISFCFLTNFELVVKEESLRKHCDVLREGTWWNVLREGVPTLTLNGPRKQPAAGDEGAQDG